MAAHTAEHCVSIVMPTHRAGPKTAQDPLRLKNLVAEAAKELAATRLRAPEVDRLLAPASSLVNDPGFWLHMEASLAIYLAEGHFRWFRLAEHLEELAVVADRWHLKPLLRAAATGQIFYVIALSQNRIRLLGGTRRGLSELALRDIPGSLAAALWFDDREGQLQSHGADRVGPGRVVATFHGHGMGKDTRDADLDRFVRAVDDGVNQILGTHGAPLVLAGVTEQVTRYRNLTRYRDVLEDAIIGNYDGLSSAELHEHAWPLVEAWFDRHRQAAATTYLAGDTATTCTLAETVLAAADGRVEELFVPAGVQRWGTAAVDQRLVTEHEGRRHGDHDLLDRAAIDTMLRGGRVHVVTPSEVPGPGPVAALLRY